MRVAPAAVFGSVARGEATEKSDVDMLVDLDPERRMGVFEYTALGFHVGELLGREADLVMRDAFKQPMRNRILHEAVNAF